MKGGEGLGVEDGKDQGTQRLPGGTVDAPLGTWLWARNAFWEQGSVKYRQTPQSSNREYD